MKRILIVEDNQDVAEIFAQLIEILGYESAIAHDVSQGLSLASSWKPQLVLCDLGLPGDGLEFARACKRDAALKDIRLLAVSGRSRPEDKRAALEAGFDDLLGKPIEFATLQAVCELA
ncbi:MAG: multi-sensor hybrid histidine kinase [Rhodocyclales bacterium]|nr:multi-sensor hybrid histidine kinase [Rhodocyclales bacterium]